MDELGQFAIPRTAHAAVEVVGVDVVRLANVEAIEVGHGGWLINDGKVAVADVAVSPDSTVVDGFDFGGNKSFEFYDKAGDLVARGVPLRAIAALVFVTSQKPKDFFGCALLGE